MRPLRIAAVFLAVVLASGCMSVSTDAYISEDAEIEKVNYKVEIDKDSYEMMMSMGNSTDTNFTEETHAFNYSSYDKENYTEGDSKVLEATFYDVKPKEEIDISVYKEEGSVVFEDPNFALAGTSQEMDTTNSFGQGSGQGLQQMNDEIKNKINITYTVNMPGTITNTTGNVVESKKAVYNMTDMQSQEGVYVKSKSSEGGIISSFVSLFSGLI